MFLQNIQLINFKNYENQLLDFSPRLNCLVGKNGMGKTNVLDAIHYLCLCKSHFSIPDRLIIKHEEEFFRIQGIFNREGEKQHIVCKYDKRKKVIEKNKVAYNRLADHIGLLPLIMITPDDTLLITEGSESRRRFIDLLLIQSDTQYLKFLMEYNKVLAQRNSFLKQAPSPSQIDSALLEIYNQQLLAPAQYIYKKRTDFCIQLLPIFKHYYSIISKSQEEANLQYKSQLSEQSLAHLLAEAQEKDCYLQRTTKGIHKDDLVLTINEYPVKKIGSQGQIKSFLLALKLAQYELLRQAIGLSPILLLDDIFDKLDSSRVEHLLQLLSEQQFGQIFLTDTHPKRAADIIAKTKQDFRQFEVINGTIVS